MPGHMFRILGGSRESAAEYKDALRASREKICKLAAELPDDPEHDIYVSRLLDIVSDIIDVLDDKETFLPYVKKHYG